MTIKNIRKHDSLRSEVVRLRSEMKKTHGDYNDHISDLALLTKSELGPIIQSLEKTELKNGFLEQITGLVTQIENVLYELATTHENLDEIVQIIGGLEFADNSTSDKLSEILNEEVREQARMNQEILHLKNFMSQSNFKSKENKDELRATLNDFRMTFSRFQDHVIESVPRVIKIFDELDREAEAGEKYGKTKQI